MTSVVDVEAFRMTLNIIQEMQAHQFLSECGWGLAGRDDSLLARAIAEGDAVDAVFTLEEEAALDDVLRYAELRGFVPLFEQLAKRMRVERINVPPLQYVWLYFVKILMGIPGVAKMSPLLLRDESLMRRLGFNAHQITNGVTERGNSRRGSATEREGPVSSEAVAQNIVKLSVLALADFFNHVIRQGVPLVITEDEVDLVVDCSLYETTEKYDGAGRTRRDRQVRTTKGQLVEVADIKYGWKVGVAYHPATGLPLAVCVTRIETDYRAHFWTVLDDARKNVGSKRIRSVSMDRGFLDGVDLWKLDQQGYEFVIPARKDMAVYADAVALAGQYDHAQANPEIKRACWEEIRTEGHGRNATQKTLVTEVVGVPGLTSMDTYGPAGHVEGQNRKDFKPNPINAVVVRTWRGRRFKEPTVFLTNGSVEEPRKPFERYDDRSLIENGVFREGKQAWSLDWPPKKSEAGVMVHVYLTLAAVALTRCYRMETEAGQLAPATPPAHPKSSPRASQSPPSTQKLKLGMERYRLDLKVQNRNKVILFLGDAYGILHVQEMTMLAGVNLRERSAGVGTREETLRKFGLLPPAGDSGSQPDG